MDRISITEFIEEFTSCIRILKNYFCVMRQVFLQNFYKNLQMVSKIYAVISKIVENTTFNIYWFYADCFVFNFADFLQ